MKIKKTLAILFSVTLGLCALTGCGPAAGGNSGLANNDAPAADNKGSGELIKVGIINNDPNESGYRNANDKDMNTRLTLHTVLRMMNRLLMHSSSFRTKLTTCSFQQPAHQAGIQFSRMPRHRKSRLFFLTVQLMLMTAFMKLQ